LVLGIIASRSSIGADNPASTSRSDSRVILLDREAQFGKAYLSMLVEEIRVEGQEIRITGRNSALIQAVEKTEAGNSFKSAHLW